MITVEHLSKRYGNKLVVNDISFTVEDRKVTGFLGPNGAGKSTTMRLMLGLSRGGGTTLYDGQKLQEYERPSALVGILLEAKAFHPTRTARNHLRVLAAADGIDDARVDEVLDIVGLKNEADHGPGKFSLGMSQRLGIAAALLGEPKYLLLDEPANGLDPEGIAWLRQFLKEYAGSGNAVFVSSHLLSEMSLIADNVVVIGKGKMIADTSMTKLISGSGHSSVYVRAIKLSQLKKLLQQRDIKFEAIEDGLEITGSTTDEVGKLAFEGGIALLELSRHDASLEEAFLELTESSEEFQARTGTTKKKGGAS
jgi:ABC-2 type transport system ATP-binding protein